ncbi:hypothetical protein PBOI14_15160 [Pseudomonas sp. Boi14]|nr:hypothetical protein PBOI14_15160 [Pseudomonas sp. Boi14]
MRCGRRGPCRGQTAGIRWRGLDQRLGSLAQPGRRQGPALAGAEPGEQGVLISPSGEPAQGTFVPGLYGDAGAQPDNREHVEVWRFDDGGSLVYDWQAKSYSISLPSGTVTIQVGTSSVLVTDSSITGNADSITLTGAITLNGEVQINGASLKHNGVNVGSTHIHPAVMPGPGATAPPQ